MVGHRPLEATILVRIQAREQRFDCELTKVSKKVRLSRTSFFPSEWCDSEQYDCEELSKAKIPSPGATKASVASPEA